MGVNVERDGIKTREATRPGSDSCSSDRSDVCGPVVIYVTQVNYIKIVR